MAEAIHLNVADDRKELPAPLPGKQTCPNCSSDHVRGVTVTSIVVYLRCEACANVWNIPQRRKMPRPSDPRRF